MPPKEKAVRRELDTFEGVAGVVGEDGPARLVADAIFARCRCICRLFASAFSCVRMKLARLCGEMHQYSSSTWPGVMVVYFDEDLSIFSIQRLHGLLL